MGCKFCASTGIAFIRSLTSGEIVEELLAVERDENIKNSLLMSCGGVQVWYNLKLIKQIS